MPDDCNADLVSKLVQDLIDVTQMQIIRSHSSHLCAQTKDKKDCEKLAADEKEYWRVNDILFRDANQFFVKCVQSKASREELGRLVARFPPE